MEAFEVAEVRMMQSMQSIGQSMQDSKDAKLSYRLIRLIPYYRTSTTATAGGSLGTVMITALPVLVPGSNLAGCGGWGLGLERRRRRAEYASGRPRQTSLYIPYRAAMASPADAATNISGRRDRHGGG